MKTSAAPTIDQQQACSAAGCPHKASGVMPRPGICKYHQRWLYLDFLPEKGWPEAWPGKPSAETLKSWGRPELVDVYWPNDQRQATASAKPDSCDR